MEIWFQDEARLGQKNGLTRLWARKGTRPRQPADQRYRNAYLFGAICPAHGKGAALMLPWADAQAMQMHLDEISRHVARKAHAVVLMDRAGWHTTGKLKVPKNLTIILLPSRAPELNPAIEANEVVSISADYFRLRRPLERRIYEIARKHCGAQKKWHIGLAKLQEKTGSNAPLKKFRLNLRQIIADDHTPFYKLELTKDDLVIFRPRTTTTVLSPNISLPEWAEEKARLAARDLGWDYQVLRRNWLEFAKAETAKGNPPKNAGAAFVAYCKKQGSLR